MRRHRACAFAALLVLFPLLFAGCNSGSKPISLTVVSPTGAQSLDLGQTFTISVQVNNDKLNKGATFTISGVGTLTGQSASGATYNAPATGAGGTATITIASATDPTKAITLTVTVTPPPSISNSSSTLTGGIQGTAYSATITTTGGAGALNYSVSSGSLPPGLSLNATSGALTGTPTGTGTFTFTVQVKDSSTASPQTSTKSFTITVNEQPSITSANSTTFVAGTAGTFQVTTTAVPTASITESGALPAGVTFTDNGNGTATIAGNSSTTGSFPITITANNNIGTAATQNFTLIIGKAPGISSAAATTFAVGTAGTFKVTTIGYPAPVLSESGALPGGVTFVDNHDGTATLAGTPAANTGGKYTFTITAHNGIGTDATQSFTLTVNQAPAVTSTSSTTFTINTAGTFKVTTSGYPAPALSESGSLPAGVTFVDNHDGTATLAGIPTASGSFPITITANNGVSPNGTQSFTLTVGQAPAITSGAVTTFTVGSAGTFSVTTSGFPAPALTETGSLPSGVTFKDNGNGTATLAGTPAAGAGGTYSFSIKAHNGIGTDATQTFTLTVDQAPGISSTASATFSVGAPGSFTVTTTGFPAPALSESGALPTGVTFHDNGNGTATLSGTASAPGSFPITITASNGVSPNATQTFTLTVNTAPGFTSANSTTFTAGSAGSFTVSATGTPTPSFSESGALPSGVTFHDNGNGTATLSGTPAANTGGAYNLTFTASNTAGSANQTFTLTVDQVPAITSATSTTFTVGTSASFTVMTTGVPNPALSESGALPSGVTFVDNGNGTATLSGTPASGTAGTYPLTITANNGVSPNATQSFTLTVNTVPVFSSGTSTTFTVGTAGSFTVTASGSPSFTLSAGTLPGGVTLADNHNGTATLAGTPATGTGGVYNFTIKATNGSGNSTQNFSLTVDEAPSFNSSTTTTFAVGQPSTFNVSASGYPAPAISESGALPSGVTFNSTTNVLSGTPATGTAGNYPITFTASNGIGTNATQNFILVVILDPCAGAGTGSEALLNGQYALLLKGFDNGTTGTETQSEPVLVGGVLTFSGSGSITAGTIDMNTNSSAGISSQSVTGGSYKVGSDHRACMSITTAAGTQHYRASLANISGGIASTGHMIDFDVSGPFTTGTLKKQDTTAFSTSKVTGKYTFLISSTQNSAKSGSIFAAIGVIDLSSGNVTGGEADSNNAGVIDKECGTFTNWPATPCYSINSGSTYTIGSDGRGTLTFNVVAGGKTSAVTIEIYVISATDFFILQNSDQTSNSISAGEALQQSGSFSNSSLNGVIIAYQSGFDCGGTNCTISVTNPGGQAGSNTVLARIAANGSGGASGTAYSSSSGTIQQQSLSGVTYTVDSNGRGSLSGVGSPILLYLSGSNRGWSLGGDNGVGSGGLEPQSATTGSGTFAFGSINPAIPGGTSEGVATFASGNVTGSNDNNNQSGGLQTGNAITGTFTIDSTGFGQVASGSSCTPTSGNCQFLFYVVSSGRVIGMDSSSDPNIQPADQ